MEELTQILSDSTAAIGNGYFRLQIDGGDPVYRERVYCYELYHQMRSRWPVNTPYYLNGEIDKAAHPILRELRADHVKPDLLVHQPGYMSGNHAVIEVKSSDAPLSGITKDLINLSLFVNTVRYERAIYLIYGHRANINMVRRIIGIASKVMGLAQIELWIHVEFNNMAIHCATILSSE